MARWGRYETDELDPVNPAAHAPVPTGMAMLTADQVRLCLKRARECQAEHTTDGTYGAANVLISLLEQVLPDLVTLADENVQLKRALQLARAGGGGRGWR